MRAGNVLNSIAAEAANPSIRPAAPSTLSWNATAEMDWLHNRLIRRALIRNDEENAIVAFLTTLSDGYTAGSP
jgi:hypothetical protein